MSAPRAVEGVGRAGHLLPRSPRRIAVHFVYTVPIDSSTNGSQRALASVFALALLVNCPSAGAEESFDWDCQMIDSLSNKESIRIAVSRAGRPFTMAIAEKAAAPLTLVKTPEKLVRTVIANRNELANSGIQASIAASGADPARVSSATIYSLGMGMWGATGIIVFTDSANAYLGKAGFVMKVANAQPCKVEGAASAIDVANQQRRQIRQSEEARRAHEEGMKRWMAAPSQVRPLARMRVSDRANTRLHTSGNSVYLERTDRSKAGGRTLVERVVLEGGKLVKRPAIALGDSDVRWESAPDGSELYAVDLAGTVIRVIDGNSGRALEELPLPVKAFSWLLAGRGVVLQHGDNQQACLFARGERGKGMLQKFDGSPHKSWLRNYAVSADGSRIALGYGGDFIDVWQVDKDRTLTTFSKSELGLSPEEMRFNAAGDQLLITGDSPERAGMSIVVSLASGRITPLEDGSYPIGFTGELPIVIAHDEQGGSHPVIFDLRTGKKLQDVLVREGGDGEAVLTDGRVVTLDQEELIVWERVSSLVPAPVPAGELGQACQLTNGLRLSVRAMTDQNGAFHEVLDRWNGPATSDRVASAAAAGVDPAKIAEAVVYGLSDPPTKQSVGMTVFRDRSGAYLGKSGFVNRLQDSLPCRLDQKSPAIEIANARRRVDQVARKAEEERRELRNEWKTPWLATERWFTPSVRVPLPPATHRRIRASLNDVLVSSEVRAPSGEWSLHIMRVRSLGESIAKEQLPVIGLGSIVRGGYDPSPWAISRDGRDLVVADKANALHVYDARTGALKEEVAPASPHEIWSVALSRDSRYVLSQWIGMGWQLWDRKSGHSNSANLANLVKPFSLSIAAFADSAFSPDGRRIARAWGVDHLDLWDIATRRVTQGFRSDADLGSLRIRTLHFTPRGDALVLNGWLTHNGTRTPATEIFSLSSRQLRVIEGCDAPRGFSGTRYVVCSIAEGDAGFHDAVFDIETGKKLQDLLLREGGESEAILEDGRIVGLEKEELIVWSPVAAEAGAQ